MTLVQTVTVGSGAPLSIDFLSIPQDADDLLVLFSGRSLAATDAAQIYLRINGSTSSIYSDRSLRGTGSSTSSSSGSSNSFINGGFISGATTTSNTFGNMAIYLPNYKSSVAKSLSIDNVMENNATASSQYLAAALFNSTSAISQINIIDPFSAGFAQHSTASLYKIKKF